MEIEKSDYLKYFRVVRYYIKKNFKIEGATLDLMLFLYSEQYFDKKKFQEFETLISFDPKRFGSLVRDGWITSLRKRTPFKQRALFTLSYKAKYLVEKMYQYLEGRDMPVQANQNRIFLKKVSSSDKVYKEFIKKLNAHNKAQRRLANPNFYAKKSG